MASEGGKIKTKRRQASSKPYDRKLTLFGKLRRSVKDLLTPSWWSGPHWESGRQAADDVDQAASSSEECSEFSVGLPVQHMTGDGIIGLDQNQSSSDSAEDENHAEPVVLGHKEGTGDLTGVGGHKQGSSNFPGVPCVNAHNDGNMPGISRLSSDSFNQTLDSKKLNNLSVSRLSGSRGHVQETQQTKDELALHKPETLDDTLRQGTERTQIQPIMVSIGRAGRSSDISQSDAKRQKLWSPESSKEKTIVSPSKEKPVFNSFLLGSMSDSSIFGDSFHKSIFYPGKTCFGGASSKRQTLYSSPPYRSSLPLRKQVTANRGSSSTFHATTSATAQRILETLDRMSTPLGDAKKIPLSTDSTNDSVLSFSPSSYRRTSTNPAGRPGTRPLQLSSRAPPTSQHQVLSQAIIAKNRHKSCVVDRRQKLHEEDDDDMPNQESGWLTEASHSETSGRTFSAERQESGKMKTKRFSQHVSRSGVEENEVVEAPSLRTDFTLPISNMSPLSLQTSLHPAKPQNVTVASFPTAGGSIPRKFTFSAPIDEKRQGYSHVAGPAAERFKFTSPTKTSQMKTSAAGAEGESKNSPEPAVGASSGINLGASSAAFTTPSPSLPPKPKMASPDIGGTSSSFKSYTKRAGYGNHDDSSAASDMPVGFSLAPAASLKTGSVMDILGGGKSASAQGTDDLMAKFKKPTGSWECDSCMLVNKPDATKCIACETSKPGTKPAKPAATDTTSIPKLGAAATTTSNTAAAVSSSSIDNLMAKFKRPAGTWECDGCMLVNKPDASKCIACEAAKPGVKQAQKDVGTENSLSAMFKKPAGSWECDICMVQNTATALRCIACDSSKPGLQSVGIVPKSAGSTGPSAITISPTGGFTLNVSAIQTTTSGSSGFKFGNTIATAPPTSLPAPTGFIFNQTSVANKNVANASSNGSLTSTPFIGGFKFGTTAAGSDSGGVASGSSSFGVGSSGSGFVSSSTLSTKTSDSVLVVSSGDTSKISTSDGQESKASSQITTAPSTQSSNGNPSTVGFSKPAGIQFGSISGTNGTTTTTSSGLLQSSFGLDSKDSNTKLSQQHVSFNFAPTSSTSVTSSFTAAPSQSQTTEKSDSSAAGPVSSLFQFGVPSTAPAKAVGLGMGASLADAKPMVNGGYGSGFQFQAVKDDSKAASQDTNKPFTNLMQPFGAAPPVFGSFGQATQTTTAPISGSVVSLASQSSKRSVDFGETEHSAAKKLFNFASTGAESSTNEVFTFGGSSQMGATASSSTGGFMFNSQTSSGPLPGGGFQFGSVPTTTTPAAPAVNFSFKNDAPKFSFEASANKGPVQFSTTPNFNFGAGTRQSGSLFQFGAKPTDSSTPVPAVFSFGAGHQPGPSADSSGFGTSSGVGAMGNFNIGAGDLGRKVKRATRRVKK